MKPELTRHVDFLKAALETSRSTHGLQAHEVNQQSLGFAVKYTEQVIAHTFKGDEMRFRLDIVRYMTSFQGYADMLGASSSFSNLEQFVKYLIVSGFQGQVQKYMETLKAFVARDKQVYAVAQAPASAKPIDSPFLSFREEAEIEEDTETNDRIVRPASSKYGRNVYRTKLENRVAAKLHQKRIQKYMQSKKES